MSDSAIFNQVYDSEYYGPSQCFLYIGDVWIDEITAFSYKLVQDKKPIYGYASQLFDDCAPGRVLVQGQFSINFKEQGYLWMVLRRYKQIIDSDVGFSSRNEEALLSVRDGHSTRMPSLTDEADIRVGSNGTRINRTSIERAIRGELTTGERNKFYHDLSGYATFRSNNNQDKVFEDIAQAFEDEIWNPESTNDALLQQTRRTDDNIFDDFDIYVLFGDHSNPRANSTSCKIVGVRLTSSGKSINIGQGPTQEYYEFYARAVI